MSDFTFYFTLGWEHIISLDALDHLLFIMALASIYLLRNWKQVLVLITAFTIGHSLTLALSAKNIVRFSSSWVEFLIPLTIVITALVNIFQKKLSVQRLRLQYGIALFFGLIHGMGFANTIRMMLLKKQSITLPLLSFNVGLEAGQVIVVTGILLLAFLIVSKAGLKRNMWINVLSGSAFLAAAYMCIQRFPLGS